LGHILNALAQNGVFEITIIVGFQEEAIRQALGAGKDYGVRLKYIQQPKWTGTASALKMAYKAVGKERFIAVYGDLMINSASVRALIDKATDSARVIGVVKMPDASQYGVIELHGDRAVGIVEKPRSMRGKPGWINAGMYVLDGDVFEAIDKTRSSKRAEYELTTSLQFLIKGGREINVAVIPESDWLDVGRPWDLLMANERVLTNLQSMTLGTVESGAIMKGRVFVDEGALIKSGSYVEGPVYCGKGSKVGPHARIRPFTSLEANVVVGVGCDIKNSIIMKGSKIPHLSYIGDSILGEHCNLGAGTITANVRFDKRTIRISIKNQLVDSGLEKLGVIMGDHVETGINVSLMPGVRVGSGSWVGPGAVVSKDLPSGKVLLVQQGHVTRDRTVSSKAKVRHAA
jgi:bifunctional UDP-N-acetylglucosamine pyrophosphorylase/glucosamine-1-phosphate N-acetyltransferase